MSRFLQYEAKEEYKAQNKEDVKATAGGRLRVGIGLWNETWKVSTEMAALHRKLRVHSQGHLLDKVWPGPESTDYRNYSGNHNWSETRIPSQKRHCFR